MFSWISKKNINTFELKNVQTRAMDHPDRCILINTILNPGPADPRYALPLQTV